MFAHSYLVETLILQGKSRTADSLIRELEARDRTGIFARRAREFRALLTRGYDGVVALALADLGSAERPEFAKTFSLFRLGAALLLQGRPQQADSAALAGEELIARLGDPSVALRNALTRAVQTLRSPEIPQRRVASLPRGAEILASDDAVHGSHACPENHRARRARPT